MPQEPKQISSYFINNCKTKERGLGVFLGYVPNDYSVIPQAE
jgi:hypothetical protein